MQVLKIHKFCAWIVSTYLKTTKKKTKNETIFLKKNSSFQRWIFIRLKNEPSLMSVNDR